MEQTADSNVTEVPNEDNEGLMHGSIVGRQEFEIAMISADAVSDTFSRFTPAQRREYLNRVWKVTRYIKHTY